MTANLTATSDSNTFTGDLRELFTDEALSAETPVYIFCTMHPDTNRPSLRIYPNGGYCFTCGAFISREKLIRHAQAVDPESITYAKLFKGRSKAARKRPFLRPAELQILAEMAHSHLTSSQWNYYRMRGLYDTTLDTYQLGHYGSGYTLPLFTDASRTHVEAIRFRRDDTTIEQMGRENNLPKYWGVRGHNEVVVYPFPIEPNATAPIILTEGEFDALILRQEGYNAYSLTNGAQSWKRIKDWSPLLPKEAPILLHYDNDAAGQTAASDMQKRLAADGYRVDRALALFTLPQVPLEHAEEGIGWKDLSELRVKYPSEFFPYLSQLERWEEIVL